MTDHQEAPLSQEEASQFARENRKRIIRFVGIFVVTTLVLLTSYRYLIHTRLNDWYLYQAARHTAWTLDRIGHGELEPYHYSRMNIQETRASLAAWAAGREEATPEEMRQVSTEPLTAWERWSYRAIDMRRKGTPRINGPRVYFVLRQGLSSQVDALMGDINRLEDDVNAEPTAKASRLDALRAELKQVREKQQDRTTDDTALIFPFILIPECGAIEIMVIFLAAVLAFPTAWWKRLVGIAAGIPAMYCVNIFRLTVLAVIGAMDKSRVWFNFAHEYVWQAVYIIFVVAVWLVWVEYVVKRTRA